MKTKPLKRMEALRPLSREHHQGLLLCWKIRAAFSKNISLTRVKRYTDWFFQHHIQPHFEIEEKLIFPILFAGQFSPSPLHGLFSFHFSSASCVYSGLMVVSLKL